MHEPNDMMNMSINDSSILNATEDSIPQKVRIYFLIGFILTVVWTILIITLNSAVIVIIYRYKKRTRLYFFLFHLAVADVLTGVIHCIPHSIERSIGYDQIEAVWLAGDFPCKLQWTLGHVSVMTSNNVLACMSVDRAFAVCRPMKSINKGYLAQKLAVFSCWVISLLACSPYLWVIKTYPNYRSKRPGCMSNYPTIYEYKVELILKLLFVFIIPFTIIVISYGSLLFAVHHRSPGGIKGDDSSQGLNRIFNVGIPKSKIKSIKLTIGIVLSFILCWCAHFSGMFMGIYGGIRHPIFFTMTTFYYLNSIANPILFFMYHRRKTLRSTSSYSSHCVRKVDNSPHDHHSLGSRLSDMKDVYVECPN